MAKYLKFVIAQACLWALAYFALYEHIAGAENLLLFVVWIAFMCSLTLPSSVAVKTLADRPFNPVLAFFSDVQAIAILLGLVWCGWAISGAAWLVTFFLVHYARQEASKVRKAKI
jgi:hypothetical protein